MSTTDHGDPATGQATDAPATAADPTTEADASSTAPEPAATGGGRLPVWVTAVAVPLLTAVVGLFAGVALNVTTDSPATTTKSGSGANPGTGNVNSGGAGNGTGNTGNGNAGPGNGNSGGTGNGEANNANGTGNAGNGTGNAGNGTGNAGNGTGNAGNGTGNAGSGTGNAGSGAGNTGSGTGNVGTGNAAGSGNGTGNRGNGSGNSNPGGAGNGTGNQGNVGTQANGGQAGGGNASNQSTAQGGNASQQATAQGGSAVNNNYFQLQPPVTAPAQENCSGLPTGVSAPAQTSATFEITVVVRCPPVQGRHYRLIVEIDDVGEHHTVNYYPSAQIPGTPGTYLYPKVVSQSEIGSSRSLFVVSVDAEQAAALDNAPNGELINGLPPGTQIVSNKVVSTRVR